MVNNRFEYKFYKKSMRNHCVMLDPFLELLIVNWSKMIRAIVEEEAKRLGMTIEIIETGDISLAR